MFKRILVPIDGSHSSATVIPYAVELAARLNCKVDLLLVEPVEGAKLPHPDHHRPSPEDGSGPVMFAMGTRTPAYVREANEQYVARHVEEFEARGVAAKGRVVCGLPAEQILAAALELRCDVIAMASRKLSSFNQPKTGSIAEEVLWRSKLPVLIVAHG